MKTKNLLEEVVAEAKRQKQSNLELLAEEIDNQDSIQNDEPVDPEIEDTPVDSDALKKQDEITDETPVSSLTLEDIKTILLQVIQDNGSEKEEEVLEDLEERFDEGQQSRMRYLAGLEK